MYGARRAPWLLAVLLLTACATAPRPLVSAQALNPQAERYVQLALALGVHDADFVDAYHGPAEARASAQREALPLAQIVSRAQVLQAALRSAVVAPDEQARQRFLLAQLNALIARAQFLHGQRLRFDDEARAWFGVAPPRYRETDFDAALRRLDALLPGEGPLYARYDAYLARFELKPEQVEPLMRTAISAARQRTRTQLALPDGEHVELNVVRGQPWAAYNWYQGHYRSRIELNLDLPLTVRGVMALAAHEGYPGHHVHNSLLEAQLLRARGWPEFGLYTLYSPQSLLAEGSAELAAGLAFPGGHYLRLEEALMRQAGLPLAELAHYRRVMAQVSRLRAAPIEAARRYLDGEQDRASTLRWLQAYALLSPARAEQRLRFIERYRSYIVTYSVGADAVRRWLLQPWSAQLREQQRWQRFAQLLGSPMTPADLGLVPAP